MFPESVLTLIAFILGIFVGSFLNVLILRHKTGRGIVGGRSFCLSCSKTLFARDMLPILSFLSLKGRCRFCKTPLSSQYPLVELSNGLLYAGALFLALPVLKSSLLVGLVYLLLLFAVSSIFLSIFVYDVKHKIIPNSWVYILAVVSLGFLFIDVASAAFVLPNAWALSGAPIVALPFFLVWLLSGGRWMGLGDAKLVWSFGWILSLSGAYTAIILGFWIGAVFSVALMALQRVQKPGFFGNSKLGLKSEIPFGPFLIIGLFTVLYTGFNLFAYIWY